MRMLTFKLVAAVALSGLAIAGCSSTPSSAPSRGAAAEDAGAQNPYPHTVTDLPVTAVLPTNAVSGQTLTITGTVDTSGIDLTATPGPFALGIYAGYNNFSGSLDYLKITSVTVPAASGCLKFAVEKDPAFLCSKVSVKDPITYTITGIPDGPGYWLGNVIVELVSAPEQGTYLTGAANGHFKVSPAP